MSTTNAATPPIPSIDSADLVLILAKILAQLEIQTEIMAASAKKADRDSKLYHDAMKTYTGDGIVTRTATHNPVR